MSAVEELKSMRGKGYRAQASDFKSPEAEPKEEMGTPRIISLTDVEKKSFEGVKPGQDLTCEVHGTMEGDHFHVMSVSPPQGGGYGSEDENKMAGMVAQRVMPTIQPSPS